LYRFGTRDWKVLTGLYILHLVLPFIFFFIIEIFCWSSRHKEGSRTATTILLTILGTQNVHPEPVFLIIISCQKQNINKRRMMGCKCPPPPLPPVPGKLEGGVDKVKPFVIITKTGYFVFTKIFVFAKFFAKSSEQLRFCNGY
jgi:hypothetical protein